MVTAFSEKTCVAGAPRHLSTVTNVLLFNIYSPVIRRTLLTCIREREREGGVGVLGGGVWGWGYGVGCWLEITVCNLRDIGNVPGE